MSRTVWSEKDETVFSSRYFYYPLEHITIEMEEEGVLMCVQLMMLATVAPPQLLRYERFRVRHRIHRGNRGQ